MRQAFKMITKSNAANVMKLSFTRLKDICGTSLWDFPESDHEQLICK